MSDFTPVAADRARLVNPFRVMDVLERARQLETAGGDIVHLEVGEPDFATAPQIVTAGVKALQGGHTAYTPAAGLPALRERIAEFYAGHHGVTVDPSRILVTPGASGALVLASNLLLNSGDTVLMPDPSYPCNRNYVHLVGARAALIPPASPGRPAPSLAQLDSAYNPTVKGLWLASPANPTGAVIHETEMQALSDWAAKRRVHLLMDEIYQGLDYAENPSATRAMGNLPSALKCNPENLVVNSFSKYFGMTGWRVGWLVVPQALAATANILAQNLFIAAPTPAQHAALRAFDDDVIAVLEQRRDAFRQRRDFLCDALRSIGFSLPWQADGAFYCYAGIERFADDSEAFCRMLLEEHGVAVTPGTDFGDHDANSYVRFAFTSAMPRLELAVQRLQRALD
ncbi:MAG TPA: aminotransferase class I/II-fold pyridoxal phosphate-dependent enzyme [Pseudohongiella sp.]|nr:aminotransferase class I/II-fold pyridoxal phosphate-dependent enzyme [Pseudohongiella sp.]HEA62190.1 aminotransferase class I/II-fold pyridoxal phosphate-dependent enzyme [Pseudohongiella sp.]